MIFLPGFSALTAFCGFSYIGSRGKARDFPSYFPSRALKKTPAVPTPSSPTGNILSPFSDAHIFSATSSCLEPPPPPPPFDSPQGRRRRKRGGCGMHAAVQGIAQSGLRSCGEGRASFRPGNKWGISLCVCRSSSASGGPLKFSFPLNCPRLKGKQPAGERPMKSCQPSTLEEGEEEPMTSKTQGFSPPKTSVLWWYASMHATLTSTHEGRKEFPLERLWTTFGERGRTRSLRPIMSSGRVDEINTQNSFPVVPPFLPTCRPLSIKNGRVREKERWMREKSSPVLLVSLRRPELFIRERGGD